MEVCGDSSTQCGESEKCFISFSPRNRGRTLEYLGDDMLKSLICNFTNTRSVFLDLLHAERQIDGHAQASRRVFL
jgi:hypothetical protein